MFPVCCNIKLMPTSLETRTKHILLLISFFNFFLPKNHFWLKQETPRFRETDGSGRNNFRFPRLKTVHHRKASRRISNSCRVGAETKCWELSYWKARFSYLLSLFLFSFTSGVSLTRSLKEVHLLLRVVKEKNGCLAVLPGTKQAQ